MKYISKNPNPQGKGVVQVLNDWGALQCGEWRQKSPEQVVRDYCFSALVLAARFQFKPVIGKTYYLYFANDQWLLSLIAPDEWSKRARGEFLAPCRLRQDMTWDITLADADEQSDAMVKARQFVDGFVETLAQQESVSAQLPFYVSELPYYPRLLATALASSLQRSLPVGIDKGISRMLGRERSSWPIISS